MMGGVLLLVSFCMLWLLLFSFDVAAVTVVLYDIVLDRVVLQVATVIVGLGLGASGHVYQFSEGLVID